MPNTDVFDRLIALRGEGEEALKRERINIINDFIESFPEERRPRLRAMQWKIDQDLEKYKNPTARMNFLIDTLFQQMADLYEALTDPDTFMERRQQRAESAEILPFRNKNSLTNSDK